MKQIRRAINELMRRIGLRREQRRDHEVDSETISVAIQVELQELEYPDLGTRFDRQDGIQQ